MKLLQHDKKVWDDGDTSHTWQFGILKNRSFLWVYYETLGGIVHSSGGFNILLSFFGSSLFSVSMQQYKFGLGFAFFAEYFEGWNDD
jgi:hypothetical protein